MKSVVLESLIPVNTKMGGPITTLFMPMSAEGSSTSLSDYAKVLKYLSDHLSEWPLFFNPASHSFLQKWLIYALSGSWHFVYKSQCSIRVQRVLVSDGLIFRPKHTIIGRKMRALDERSFYEIVRL